MKLKICLSVAILVAIIVVDSVFNNVVSPEVSTNLALEQFENPSIETDTKIRAFNNVSLFLYAYVSWFVFTILMFARNIKDLFKNA